MRSTEQSKTLSKQSGVHYKYLSYIRLRHAYQKYVCVSLKSGNRSPIQTVKYFKTPLPYFSYKWNTIAHPDPFGSEPFCQTGSDQNKPDPDPDPASEIEITLRQNLNIRDF